MKILNRYGKGSTYTDSNRIPQLLNEYFFFCCGKTDNTAKRCFHQLVTEMMPPSVFFLNVSVLNSTITRTIILFGGNTNIGFHRNLISRNNCNILLTIKNYFEIADTAKLIAILNDRQNLVGLLLINIIECIVWCTMTT